jgi:hypothetical protein
LRSPPRRRRSAGRRLSVWRKSRAFIDEIVGRRNGAHGKRIDTERPHLQALPDRRTTDFEEVVVTVSRTGGFTLRKVFYTVPSRLIGHRLCVRLFDDRLDVFIGGTHLLTLPRGRAHASGKHDQVVNDHHVIHSLRKKPMALLNLVYRDKRAVDLPRKSGEFLMKDEERHGQAAETFYERVRGGSRSTC